MTIFLIVVGILGADSQAHAAEGAGEDVVQAPKGAMVARETSSEVAVVMGLLLREGKWRSDAGKRIGAFLQAQRVEGPREVDKWLSQTLTGSASPEDAAVLQALGLKPSDYGPRDVAALYYLLGAGRDVLAGEREESIRNILDEAAPPAKAGMREQLAACLGRYAPSGQPGSAEYCRKGGIEPLKAGSSEWVRAFCTEASITAFRIYDASKRNPALSAGDAPAEPRKEEAATGGGGGPQPLSVVDLSQPSDVAELFGKWGDVNVVHMPSRAPKEGEDPTKIPGRTLAIVIRTMRAWGGDPRDPRPKSVQQIGVYDISNPVDIYGKRFDMSADATNTFSLKPGGAEYVLKFSPQGEDVGISLERADGVKPVYGPAGQTSLPTLNGLFRHRAEKARGMGNLVEVGGQQYYVLGESAKQGALAFFSKNMLDTMDRYRGTDLVPDMVAYTNQKADGRVERLGDSVSLGKVGDKWYELRWNAAQGYWEPVAGKPPGVERPAADTTSPGTPTPQEPAADEWPAFDLPNLGLRINATNKDVAAINAALKAAGLDVRVYSCEPGRAPYENFFLMHKSRLHVPVTFAGGRIPKADFGGFELLGGSVLAVRDKTGAVYYDLKSDPEGWGDVWKAEGGGFDIGKGRSTWQGDARAEGIYLAARDAARSSDLSSKVEEIIARVAKKVQEGAALEKMYKVGGGEKVFAKFAGQQSVEVWPDLGTSGPSQEVEGKPGRIAFDPIHVPPTGWDPMTGFADTLPMGELRLSKVKDPKFEKTAAALYTAEKGGIRSTYIQFRIGKDGRSVSPVLVFQDAVDPSKDKDRIRIKYPGNAAIGIRGVKASEDPLQLCAPRKFDGRGLEAAGYIPVRDGPETGHGRFKGNLAGIAAWWGSGVTLEKVFEKEGLNKEDIQRLLAELP